RVDLGGRGRAAADAIGGSGAEARRMIEINLLPGKKKKAAGGGAGFKLALPDFQGLLASVKNPWLLTASAASVIVVGGGLLLFITQRARRRRRRSPQGRSTRRGHRWSACGSPEARSTSRRIPRSCGSSRRPPG